MEAFEVEPSYDREDPFAPGPRVLWGRVGALAGVVVLFFLLGRVTGGGGGDTKTLTTQLNAANARISSLEAELATANGTGASPNATGVQASPSPSLGPASQFTPSPSASSTSSTNGNGTGAANTYPIAYTVKAGDTLTTIEEKFYRNASPALTTLLESTNSLTNANLHTGQQITIPDPGTAGGGTTTPTTPSPRPSPSSTKH